MRGLRGLHMLEDFRRDDGVGGNGKARLLGDVVHLASKAIEFLAGERQQALAWRRNVEEVQLDLPPLHPQHLCEAAALLCHAAAIVDHLKRRGIWKRRSQMSRHLDVQGGATRVPVADQPERVEGSKEAIRIEHLVGRICGKHAERAVAGHAECTVRSAVEASDPKGLSRCVVARGRTRDVDAQPERIPLYERLLGAG